MPNMHSLFRVTKVVLKSFLVVSKNKWILLDTPTHGNLGDHAIAIAECCDIILL